MAKSTDIPDYIWKSFLIPFPEREYKFHEARKWRIDYAWPEFCIAIEQEGAVWVQGRHTRGSGFVKDMEKYNALAELGWILLRYQPNKFDYAQIKRTIERKCTGYDKQC
jgi:hypothetical protein